MSHHVNPFGSDINPATSKGLRHFFKVIKPLKEERFDLKSDNAKALMNHLSQVSSCLVGTN